METIQLSVIINASPWKIWTVLTEKELVRQWAGAFAEGTWLDTTWQPGTPASWNSAQGDVFIQGEVAVFEPPLHISIIYEEDNPPGSVPPGTEPYTENFYIEENEKEARLRITSGPLAEDDVSKHQSLWQEALKRIKEICEQQSGLTS